jgi:hypothetical protein
MITSGPGVPSMTSLPGVPTIVAGRPKHEKFPGTVVLVVVVEVEVDVEVVEVDDDDVVGDDGEVTPQTARPMNRSPNTVGPRKRWWAAFTVIEPSGFTTCSLKMY